MGSGSLNAISVLETRFKDDLSREEAINIAINAIAAGIYHDLGSGSNVDYYIITKSKVGKYRNAVLYKDFPSVSIYFGVSKIITNETMSTRVDT
jgi:20S proteasome subunit beta 2